MTSRGSRSSDFISRQQEMAALTVALDDALLGRGRLVMLAGEPGIGKSSLCDRLSTHVALRGGVTLTGHWYEEGSVSLPYLPFVEVLRAHVKSQDPDALRSQLGSGASALARIVVEIRELLGVNPRPPVDPEEDRYHLMQSVASALRNAADVRPLLIVIEDLHNADKGTLDMLTHVARSLSGARLLVVGTYRDVEVQRGHPLSEALTELRRVSPVTRIGYASSISFSDEPAARLSTMSDTHTRVPVIQGLPWHTNGSMVIRDFQFCKATLRCSVNTVIHLRVVELGGFEPPTSSLQKRRSPELSYSPRS